MAKKSMIERELKREALVAQYAAKRAALKAIIADQIQAGRRAVQGEPQACQAAAQFVGDPVAQSLPTDRSSACLLP